MLHSFLFDEWLTWLHGLACKNYERFSFTWFSITQARVSARLSTMNDLVSMPPTGLLEKAVKLGYVKVGSADVEGPRTHIQPVSTAVVSILKKAGTHLTLNHSILFCQLN